MKCPSPGNSFVEFLAGCFLCDLSQIGTFLSRLTVRSSILRNLLGIRIINVPSNGYPPKRKPVIMRRKHVWSVERVRAENPTTIQTMISRETKRFSRMVISSSAVDLLWTLPAKQRPQTKGAVLGILNKNGIQGVFDWQFQAFQFLKISQRRNHYFTIKHIILQNSRVGFRFIWVKTRSPVENTMTRLVLGSKNCTDLITVATRAYPPCSHSFANEMRISSKSAKHSAFWSRRLIMPFKPAEPAVFRI